MAKRIWKAGKPEKKPGYCAEAIQKELIDVVVSLYQHETGKGGHPSLKAMVDQLSGEGVEGMNTLKVRKMLITAGAYESDKAELIGELFHQGESVEEIMKHMNLSRASVNSYLPYQKGIYKRKEAGAENSALADRERRFRERKRAVELLARHDNMEYLWNAIVQFADYPFETAKGFKFMYSVRGNELVIRGKEKTVTKSIVELAFQKEKQHPGEITGPKCLGVFGASYLYPIFQRFGLCLNNERNMGTIEPKK